MTPYQSRLIGSLTLLQTQIKAFVSLCSLKTIVIIILYWPVTAFSEPAFSVFIILFSLCLWGKVLYWKSHDNRSTDALNEPLILMCYCMCIVYYSGVLGSLLIKEKTWDFENKVVIFQEKSCYILRKNSQDALRVKCHVMFVGWLNYMCMF